MWENISYYYVLVWQSLLLLKCFTRSTFGYILVFVYFSYWLKLRFDLICVYKLALII